MEEPECSQCGAKNYETFQRNYPPIEGIRCLVCSHEVITKASTIYPDQHITWTSNHTKPQF